MYKTINKSYKTNNNYYIDYIFKKFIKENNINLDFLEYIKIRTFIVPNTFLDYGCFPILNKDNILIDIRLLVPKMSTIKDLSINIHEYTHAFELYNELGRIYEEDKSNRELRAIEMEKKYIRKLTNS